VTLSSTTQQTADPILQQACARNTPIELEHEQRGTHRMIRMRSRLLGMAEGGIVIDRPQSSGEGRLPEGEEVSVYMILDGRRFAFKSTLLSQRWPYRLNEAQQVMGALLRHPQRLRQAQRRSHYRIAITGREGCPIVIAKAHPTTANACPVGGAVGVGDIVNISGGGASVLLHVAKSKMSEMGHRLNVLFRLPGMNDLLWMHCVVRHAREIPTSGAVRLGLEFVAQPGQDFARCRQEITRVITEIERKMLQRKR